MRLDRISEKLRDAKIPLLLLCAGLLLMLASGHGKNNNSTEEDTSQMNLNATESLMDSEKRLSALLREIDGVGETHVLLSYDTTSETEYVNDGGETVLLSAGSGTETALVKVMRYPRYQGAVIVCQGANQSSVKLCVIEATARYTGLRSDQITVLQLRK